MPSSLRASRQKRNGAAQRGYYKDGQVPLHPSCLVQATRTAPGALSTLCATSTNEPWPWAQLTRLGALQPSAGGLGGHPAGRPGASAGSDYRVRRHGLPLTEASTRHVDDVVEPGDLVVAVCDLAYEQLGQQRVRLHWSVPDPGPRRDGGGVRAGVRGDRAAGRPAGPGRPAGRADPADRKQGTGRAR